MRDRMERLVLFPFAVGCMSESSVGIASQHPRRSSSSGHSPPSPPPLPPKGGREEAEDQTLSDDDQCSKSSWTLPKPNLSVGMNRLFKGFKNFSHLFVYKEDEEEEIEMEKEIEIGVPTDVKHVSHIGWDDGATNYSIIKLEGNWDHDNHQKLQLLAAKFNHHHQLDDDPSSSTATADPAPIVPDHHDDLNIYIADHDQDSEEIASIGRYSRSIINHH